MLTLFRTPSGAKTVLRFSAKTQIHMKTSDTSTPSQQLNMILTSSAVNGLTSKISDSTALRLLRDCWGSFPVRSLKTATNILLLVSLLNLSAPPFVVVAIVLKQFLSPSLSPSTASSAPTALQEKSLDISSLCYKEEEKLQIWTSCWLHTATRSTYLYLGWFKKAGEGSCVNKIISLFSCVSFFV